MDGGAMFGVVPKPLWAKKYPVNENNQIELRTDPILVQANGLNMLIDSGIGNGKMNDKQRRNFGVTEESNLVEDLGRLGIQPNDIDYILMTHLHFDHACGLTKRKGENWVPVFERAEIITTQTEWKEMQNPNIRSKSTYWAENWEAVASLIRPLKGSKKLRTALKWSILGVIVMDMQSSSLKMAEID